MICSIFFEILFLCSFFNLPSITWRLILFPSLKNFPQNSQGNLTPWYVLTCLLKVCLSGNPVFSQPGHNNSTIPCSTSKCSQKALSPCRSSGQDLHFQNWVSNHFWVLGIDRAFWKCLHKWTTCSKFSDYFRSNYQTVLGFQKKLSKIMKIIT